MERKAFSGVRGFAANLARGGAGGRIRRVTPHKGTRIVASASARRAVGSAGRLMAGLAPAALRALSLISALCCAASRAPAMSQIDVVKFTSHSGIRDTSAASTILS